MKLLAKCELFKEKFFSFWYNRIGSASLYISGNQGFCVSCGNMFSFSKINPFTQTVYCPKCGKGFRYRQNEIIVSEKYDKDLPYITEMKIYELKHKIELRIRYSSRRIDSNILHNGIGFADVKEKYTFDIVNRSVVWEKYLHNVRIDRQDIGYLTDFDKLKENTAIYFFGIDDKNYYGENLTILLRTLRTAIIRKIYEIYKIKLKDMYIANLSLKNRLFGNVLNMAHRVRFFDSPNIIYDKNFSIVKKHFIDDILGENFEQVYDELKQDYVSGVINLLQLPKTRFLKQNFSFRNLFILKSIYQLDDIRLANTVFNFYLKYEKDFVIKGNQNSIIYNMGKRIDKMNVCIRFIKLLYLQYYRHIKLSNILGNCEKLQDIMNLYVSADEKTLSAFHQQKVSFNNLHDWLSLEVAKQKDNDLKFDIPQELIDKYDTAIQKHHFSCIEKYSSLKEIAFKLRNCSAGYKDRINCSLQLIAITDEQGKIKALLEINNNNILQAKLFQNRPVKQDILINRLVIDFAQKLKLKIKTDDIETFDKMIALAS